MRKMINVASIRWWLFKKLWSWSGTCPTCYGNELHDEPWMLECRRLRFTNLFLVDEYGRILK